MVMVHILALNSLATQRNGCGFCARKQHNITTHRHTGATVQHGIAHIILVYACAVMAGTGTNVRRHRIDGIVLNVCECVWLTTIQKWEQKVRPESNNIMFPYFLGKMEILLLLKSNPIP